MLLYFPIIDDGSEVTHTVYDGSDSSSYCSAHCSSTVSEINRVYYAIRRIDIRQFKCKCLDGSDKSFVAGKNLDRWTDARYIMDCTPVADEYMKGLDSATDLNDFLKVGKSELPNKNSMDEGEEPNICNPLRTVNIATLYLAHHLGLSVSKIINDYAWDSTKTHVFPSPGLEVFIPHELTDFPNLEQAYWTIISHYTKDTEPAMRYGKDRMWCIYYGVAVYDHCMKTVTEAGCENLVQSNLRRDHCRMIHKNYTEVCHRVRSLDTTEPEYRIQSTERYWCQNKEFIESELSLYVLYRGYVENCLSMVQFVFSGGVEPVLSWKMSFPSLLTK